MKTLLHFVLLSLFAFCTLLCPASECSGCWKPDEAYTAFHDDYEEAREDWLAQCLDTQTPEQLQAIFNSEAWKELKPSIQLAVFDSLFALTDQTDIIQARIDGRLALSLSPEELAAATKEYNEFYTCNWLENILCNESFSIAQRLDFAEQIIAKGTSLSRGTLEECCNMGERELIAFCLKHGASLKKAHMGWLAPIDDGDKLRDCFAYLLEVGVNVNGMDEWGRSPLLDVALHGNKALFKLLLEKGLDIHQKDEDGDPIIVAMAQRFSWGDDDMDAGAYFELLLQAGADINARGQYQRTPLIAAASSNELETLDLLLAKGAELELHDEEGYSALMTACMSGYVEAAKLLIAKGADILTVDKHGDCILHNIILFDQSWEITIDDDSGDVMPYSHANHIKLFTLLLEHGLDVDMLAGDKGTPLMSACILGNKSFVTYLLEKGAKPCYSYDGFNMLHAAVIGSLGAWDSEIFSIIYEKQDIWAIVSFWLSIAALLAFIVSPLIVLLVLIIRSLYKKIFTKKPPQS